jgi:hypothetical protein
MAGEKYEVVILHHTFITSALWEALGDETTSIRKIPKSKLQMSNELGDSESK